jgi:hypothetical protein
MKVAIVGSRDFPKMSLVREWMEKNLVNGDIVISGGARGVDSMAEAVARQMKLATIIFKADWDTLGKRAGYLRNIDIVKEADKVVAFWDGTSKGTLSTIELANAAKKPCEVIK